MSGVSSTKMSSYSITFYTDGACSGNHRSGRMGRMGAGIVGIADGHHREWSVPLGPGTNQMAELLAVSVLARSGLHCRPLHWQEDDHATSREDTGLPSAPT